MEISYRQALKKRNAVFLTHFFLYNLEYVILFPDSASFDVMVTRWHKP